MVIGIFIKKQYPHGHYNAAMNVNFLFCVEVALEHFGITWRILHRTSKKTKNHREIEVNPSALWLACFFGQIGPTQP